MDPGPPPNVEDLRQNLLSSVYQRFARPKAHRSRSMEGSEGELDPHLRIVDVYSLNEGPPHCPIELTSDPDGSLGPDPGPIRSISGPDQDVIQSETKKKIDLWPSLLGTKMDGSTCEEAQIQRDERLDDSLEISEAVLDDHVPKAREKTRKRRKRTRTDEEEPWMGSQVEEDGQLKGTKKIKGRGEPSDEDALGPAQDGQLKGTKKSIFREEHPSQSISNVEGFKKKKIKGQGEPSDEDALGPAQGMGKSKKRPTSDKGSLDVDQDDEDVELIEDFESIPAKKKGKKSGWIEATRRKILSEKLAKVAVFQENMWHGESIGEGRKKKRSQGIHEEISEESVKRLKGRHSEGARVQDSIDFVGMEEAPLKKKREKKRSKERAENNPSFVLSKESLSSIEKDRNRSQEAQENDDNDLMTVSEIEEPPLKRKREKKRSKEKAAKDAWEKKTSLALSKESLSSIEKNQKAPKDDFVTVSQIEEPPLKKKKKKKRSKRRAENDALENNPSFVLSKESLASIEKDQNLFQNAQKNDLVTVSEIEEPPLKKKKKKKRSKRRAEKDAWENNPSFALSKESLASIEKDQNPSQEIVEDDLVTVSEMEEPPLKKKRKKKKSRDKAEKDPLVNPTLYEEPLSCQKLTKKKKKKNKSQGMVEEEALMDIPEAIIPEEVSPIKKLKKKSKGRARNDTLNNPDPEMNKTHTNEAVRLTELNQVKSKDSKEDESLEISLKQTLKRKKKKRKKAKEVIEIPLEGVVESGKKMKKHCRSGLQLDIDIRDDAASTKPDPAMIPKVSNESFAEDKLDQSLRKRKKKSKDRIKSECFTEQSITETRQDQKSVSQEKIQRKKKKKKAKEKDRIPTEHEPIHVDSGLPTKKKRKTKSKDVDLCSTEPPQKRPKKAADCHENVPPEQSQPFVNDPHVGVVETVDPKTKKKKRRKKRKNIANESQNETTGWGSISRIENPTKTEQLSSLNLSVEDSHMEEDGTRAGSKADPKLLSNPDTRTRQEKASVEPAEGMGPSYQPTRQSVGWVEHDDDSVGDRRVQKEMVEQSKVPANDIDPDTIVGNPKAHSLDLGPVHLEPRDFSYRESRQAFEQPDRTVDSVDHGPDFVDHGSDPVEHGSDSVDHGPDPLVSGPTSVDHGPDFVVHGSDPVEHGPDFVDHGPDPLESGPTSVDHGPDFVVHGSDPVEHGPTPVEPQMEHSTFSCPDIKMTSTKPSIPVHVIERSSLTEGVDQRSTSSSALSNVMPDQGRLAKIPKRVSRVQASFEPEMAESMSDSDSIRSRLSKAVRDLSVGSTSSNRSSISSSPRSVFLSEDERSDPVAEPLPVPNTPPDAIDAEPDADVEPVEANVTTSQSVMPKNLAQETNVIEGYQDSSDEEPTIPRTQADWQVADGRLNQVWNRFNERLDNEPGPHPPTNPKNPESNSEGVTNNPDDDANTFEYLAEKRRKDKEKIAEGSSLKRYRFKSDTIMEDLLSISNSEEIPNHSMAKPTPSDIKDSLPLDAIVKIPNFKSGSFPLVAKMVQFVFNENIRLPPLNREEDPALVRRAFGSRLKKLESQFPSFKHGFFSDVEDEVVLLRFGKLIRALHFTPEESQKLVMDLITYRKGGQTADRKKARSYLSAYVGLPLLHYRRLADIFQRVTFLLTRESEATLFSPETIKKIVQFFNKYGVDKVGECRRAAGINPIVGDHVIHDMYWQHRVIKKDMEKPLRRFTREESYHVLYKVLKQAKTYDVKSIESSDIDWNKVAQKLARIPTTCQRHWETRIKPIILTHLAGEDCLDMSWKLRFYKQVYHDPKVLRRSNINYREMVAKDFPNQTAMVLQRCMDNDFLRAEKKLQRERTMAKLPPLTFKESLAVFIKRFSKSKNTKWDAYHLKHMEGIISCYRELKDTIDFDDIDDEGPDFNQGQVNETVNDSDSSQ